jgi:hypothetical protein
MVPAGYLAKKVATRPDYLLAPQVTDIYSVSGCISEMFDNYVDHWKHNGFWLFDSPEIIRSITVEDSIVLDGLSLFYYEVFEREFDGKIWQPFEPDPSFKTSVVVPSERRLEGFDVVSFYCRNMPECSPLSCNSMSKEILTNSHCLLASFLEAESLVTSGAFNDSEPGPYRIFAVYSVNWIQGSTP